MKTRLISAYITILCTCLCMCGCKSGHSDPTVPADTDTGTGRLAGHINIFEWIGDERFTRSDHPFVGAGMVAPRSVDAIAESYRPPERSANATYNWENKTRVEANWMDCAVDLPFIILNSQGKVNWGASNEWAVNYDVYYKDGVTHIVYQKIEIMSNWPYLSSKIYYSRWNGNVSKEATASCWMNPIEICDSTYALHVNPTIAVNDRNDVLVVFGTHDSPPSEGRNVFYPPDHPDQGPGDFTYSTANEGQTVRLYAATLERNSSAFAPLELEDDTYPDNVPYGAYPDVTGYHYSHLDDDGFYLVYEDREAGLGDNPRYYIKGIDIYLNEDGIYEASLPNVINRPDTHDGVLPTIAFDNSYVYIAWYECAEGGGIGRYPDYSLKADLHVAERVASVAGLGKLPILPDLEVYWTKAFELSEDVTIPLDRVLRHPGLAVDWLGRHALTWAGFTGQTSPDNKVWVQVYDAGWWGEPVVTAPSYNRGSDQALLCEENGYYPSVDSYINRHYRDIILGNCLSDGPGFPPIAYKNLYWDTFGHRQRWPSEVEFRDPDVALDSVGGINVSYTLLFRLGADEHWYYHEADPLFNWPLQGNEPDDGQFPVNNLTEGYDPTTRSAVIYESDCAYWNGSGWTLRDIFVSDVGTANESVADSFARSQIQDHGVFLDQRYGGGINRSPGGGYPLGFKGNFNEDLDYPIFPIGDLPTENGLACVPVVRVVHDNITIILGSFVNGNWVNEMKKTSLNTNAFTSGGATSLPPTFIWMPYEDRVDFGKAPENDVEWPSAVFDDPIRLDDGAAPDVACDNAGNTYVAYSKKADDDCWHVFVRRRAPNGEWDEPVDISGEVDTGNPGNDELPSIAVNTYDGSLHLAWQRRATSPAELDAAYNIFYAHSRDGGRRVAYWKNVTGGESATYRGDADIAVCAYSVQINDPSDPVSPDYEWVGTPQIVWVQDDVYDGEISDTSVRHTAPVQDAAWTVKNVLDGGEPEWGAGPSIMPQVACDNRFSSNTVVVWSQWGPEPQGEPPIDENTPRYFIARRVRSSGGAWDSFGDDNDYAWEENDGTPGDNEEGPDHFLGPRIHIDQETGVETLVYFGNGVPVDQDPHRFEGNLCCGVSRVNSAIGVIEKDPLYWMSSGGKQNRALHFPDCTQKWVAQPDPDNDFAWEIELHPYNAFPVMDVDRNGIPQVLWLRWEHRLREPGETEGNYYDYTNADDPRYLLVFDELESLYYDWAESVGEGTGTVGFYDPYRAYHPGSYDTDCGVTLTSDDPDHSLHGPLMGVETPYNHTGVACDSHNRVHLVFVGDSSFAEAALGPEAEQNGDVVEESGFVEIVDPGTDDGDLNQAILPYIFYQYSGGTEAAIWYMQKTYSDPAW